MKKAVIVAVAVVAVVAGGGVWLFGAGGAEPSVVTAAPLQGGSPEEVDYVLVAPTVAVFAVGEELRGSPRTVVGTSDVVSGRIAVNPTDPGASRIGEIVVDARAFTTDSALRDRAIRGRILESDRFEFITFVPTGIEGLEAPVTEGEEVSFMVVGDLTVRDITRQVVFAVTVTLRGDRLEGDAVAQIRRSDFDLEIPAVRGVANVGEQVEIALDFVAERE